MCVNSHGSPAAFVEESRYVLTRREQNIDGRNIFPLCDIRYEVMKLINSSINIVPGILQGFSKTIIKDEYHIILTDGDMFVKMKMRTML